MDKILLENEKVLCMNLNKIGVDGTLIQNLRLLRAC